MEQKFKSSKSSLSPYKIKEHAKLVWLIIQKEWGSWWHSELTPALPSLSAVPQQASLSRQGRRKVLRGSTRGWEQRRAEQPLHRNRCKSAGNSSVSSSRRHTTKLNTPPIIKMLLNMLVPSWLGETWGAGVTPDLSIPNGCAPCRIHLLESGLAELGGSSASG